MSVFCHTQTAKAELAERGGDSTKGDGVREANCSLKEKEGSCLTPSEHERFKRTAVVLETDRIFTEDKAGENF